MLKTRILTALLILAVFLPSLFYLPQREWCVLIAVLGGVAAWEWGAFMRLTMRGRTLMGGLVAVLCLILMGIFPGMLGLGEVARLWQAWPLLLASMVFWVLLVPLWLRFKWPLGGLLPGVLTGLVVVIPTWVAMAQLRGLSPKLLLAVMAAVWLADIGAYFFGKQLGRHKLAPGISPGKTWEGAIGGALVVLVYGLILREIFGFERFSLVWSSIALLVLAAFSVIGDLLESLLKRQVGLKDSSGVLPGHGGVMDRIDSLTSALPLVALLSLGMQEFSR